MDFAMFNLEPWNLWIGMNGYKRPPGTNVLHARTEYRSTAQDRCIYVHHTPQSTLICARTLNVIIAQSRFCLVSTREDFSVYIKI